MEKPLNVQVAEALGCSPVYESGYWKCPCERPDLPPDAGRLGMEIVRPDRPRHIWMWGRRGNEVAPYDQSWHATGWYIEKYGISLNYFVCVEECCPPDGIRWTAAYGSLGLEFPDYKVEDHTPLVAVCKLLLKLGEAGKL